MSILMLTSAPSNFKGQDTVLVRGKRGPGAGRGMGKYSSSMHPDCHQACCTRCLEHWGLHCARVCEGQVHCLVERHAQMFQCVILGMCDRAKGATDWAGHTRQLLLVLGLEISDAMLLMGVALGTEPLC